MNTKMSKKEDPISALQAAQIMAEMAQQRQQIPMQTAQKLVEAINKERIRVLRPLTQNQIEYMQRYPHYGHHQYYHYLQQSSRPSPPSQAVTEIASLGTSEFTSNQPTTSIDNSTFDSNQANDDWTFASVNAMRRSKPSRPTPY
jgi:hypothetical protein